MPKGLEQSISDQLIRLVRELPDRLAPILPSNAVVLTGGLPGIQEPSLFVSGGTREFAEEPSMRIPSDRKLLVRTDLGEPN